MTSHLIDHFNQRTTAVTSAVGDCTFCDIAAGRQPAHKVYEDDDVLAFLDILPIRTGHLLVVPKRHYERVSHLPDDLSAAIGRTLPRIARALCRAVDQPDFNIVSNQGYAQVVPHVHYHLVPAPRADAPRPSRTPAARLFAAARTELDDDDGAELARRIRDELAREQTGGDRRVERRAKL
ncbi:hypothetical protein JCM11491_003459 [Sporobolomyces phaffii]